jgi:hypothetical protein
VLEWTLGRLARALEWLEPAWLFEAWAARSAPGVLAWPVVVLEVRVSAPVELGLVVLAACRFHLKEELVLSALRRQPARLELLRRSTVLGRP